MREAKAYQSSIYLMVSMPYLLLGSFGYLIYRSVRKADQFVARVQPPAQDPSPAPSPAEPGLL